MTAPASGTVPFPAETYQLAHRLGVLHDLLDRKVCHTWVCGCPCGCMA